MSQDLKNLIEEANGIFERLMITADAYQDAGHEEVAGGIRVLVEQKRLPGLNVKCGWFWTHSISRVGESCYVEAPTWFRLTGQRSHGRNDDSMIHYATMMEAIEELAKAILPAPVQRYVICVESRSAQEIADRRIFKNLDGAIQCAEDLLDSGDPGIVAVVIRRDGNEVVWRRMADEPG